MGSKPSSSNLSKNANGDISRAMDEQWEHDEFSMHLLDDIPMIDEDEPTSVPMKPAVPAGPLSRGGTSYVELEDVINDVGDESAIADSTSMFIMEFLPFCTSEDPDTMQGTLRSITDTPDAEINLNAQDAIGNTMLLLATQVRFVPAANALLKRKADPNIVNNYGISALIHACGEESYSPELAERLLEAKANPNLREHEYRCTAIHYAAAIEGTEGLLKLLIEHKANTLVEDSEGYQPLDYAADYEANAKIIEDAMKGDTVLEEEELKQSWADDPDATYVGFSDEMIAEIDEADDGGGFTSPAHAALGHYSSTDNLMHNIEYETADDDAKMLMSTWKQLAWGMGAQKITKKMDDDIQEATRQLSELKRELDAAVDSGVRADTEVLKRLRSSLAVVRKKISSTKAQVLENNTKIAAANAKASAQVTMWKYKIESSHNVNVDLEDQIKRFRKELEQIKSNKNNSVQALRQRLVQQIQEEQQRVDTAEEALAMVEAENIAFQSEFEAEDKRGRDLQQKVQELEKAGEDLKKLGGEIKSGTEQRVQKSRAKEAKKWRLHRSDSWRKIEEQKNNAQKENAKVKKSYNQEVMKRHQLKSVIDDMKGRSRAFCNFKYTAPNDTEAKTEAKIAAGLNLVQVQRKSDYSLDIKIDGRFVEFEMDFVYPEGCPLITLFPPLKPLCKKVVTGFSVCIFSMGSDFTGKSISMHGSTANARAAGNNDQGISGQTIKEIIKLSKREQKKFKVSLSLQMVEILRDGDAVDLLSDTPNPVMVKDDVGGSVILEGAQTVPVETFEQVTALFDQALAKSSRSKDGGIVPNDEDDLSDEGRGCANSHIVQVFRVHQQSIKRKFSKTGKLTLIDTVDDTQVEELHSVVESQARATSKRHNVFEVRRVSPLCQLFAEAIGGNCKTLMLMQTSHEDNKAAKTVEFVEMMKKIQNDCIANVETAALRKLKDQLKHLMEMQSQRGALPSQVGHRPSIHRPGV